MTPSIETRVEHIDALEAQVLAKKLARFLTWVNNEVGTGARVDIHPPSIEGEAWNAFVIWSKNENRETA